MGEAELRSALENAGWEITRFERDVITVTLAPQAAAKLAAADALAAGRSLAYELNGHIDATPDQGKLRSFEVERSSALSPAPGLPGVLR